MSNKKLSDMPVSKERDSIYDFNEIRLLLMRNPSPNDPDPYLRRYHDDYMEVILCLANKIKELEDKLNTKQYNP